MVDGLYAGVEGEGSVGGASGLDAKLDAAEAEYAAHQLSAID